MRFIPDYRVCYKGEFYECGEEFNIDQADAEEMREHGEIVEESPPAVEKPRRGGRRKADDEPGADETSDG